jgi:hypothetical protein
VIREGNNELLARRRTAVEIVLLIARGVSRRITGLVVLAFTNCLAGVWAAQSS